MLSVHTAKLVLDLLEQLESFGILVSAISIGKADAASPQLMHALGFVPQLSAALIDSGEWFVREDLPVAPRNQSLRVHIAVNSPRSRAVVSTAVVSFQAACSFGENVHGMNTSMITLVLWLNGVRHRMLHNAGMMQVAAVPAGGTALSLARAAMLRIGMVAPAVRPATNHTLLGTNIARFAAYYYVDGTQSVLGERLVIFHVDDARSQLGVEFPLEAQVPLSVFAVALQALCAAPLAALRAYRSFQSAHRRLPQSAFTCTLRWPRQASIAASAPYFSKR